MGCPIGVGVLLRLVGVPAVGPDPVAVVPASGAVPGLLLAAMALAAGRGECGGDFSGGVGVNPRPVSGVRAYPCGYVPTGVRSPFMTDVFHALADPHRRTIVDRLYAGPATVTELAAIVPVARPGVSRHLRVLREAGLVAVSSSGQFRHYRLEPAPLAQLDSWLATYRDLWIQRLDALHTEVERGRRTTANTREHIKEES